MKRETIKFLKAWILLAGSILLIWVGSALMEDVQAGWTAADITTDGTTWFTSLDGDNPSVKTGYLCDAKRLACSPFVAYTDVACTAGQTMAMLVSIVGGPFQGSGPIRATCIDSGEKGSVLVMNKWDDINSTELERGMVTGVRMTAITIMASGNIFKATFELTGATEAIISVIQAAEQSTESEREEAAPANKFGQPTESMEF